LLPFKNALHTAIDYGSLDVVRTLLENGIDPNAGGHMLTDLDVPRHSPSGSSGPSERCNIKPASIQCEIDEETGFDIHDIYHYDTARCGLFFYVNRSYFLVAMMRKMSRGFNQVLSQFFFHF